MTPTTQHVRLGDLSAEAFAAAAKDSPVILLPLGSHEDHGPHQPMGDYILADMMAGEIARRASARGTPTFVAPALPFGVADYFGSSPGGLALTSETFRRVLQELLEGLLRHGLRRIIILNAHGGNVPVIHDVTLDFRRTKALVIPSFYLWKVARQLMEGRSGISDKRFGHGAEPLLSLNMAMRPGCIVGAEPEPLPPRHVLGLPVSGFGTLDFQGVAVEAPVEFDEAGSAAIAVAWPEGSAGLGAEVAEALIAVGADFVKHFSSIAA